jgi:hypothetical protein
MPSEESPAERFDRVKRKIQDSILRDYPNPERRGCPGEAVLRRFAAIPLDQPISEDDPNWQHVTHCSECYREFLAFTAEYRERANARRVRLRWTVAAVAVLVAIAALLGWQRGLFGPKRPQNAELAYFRQTVDIPSMQRSVNADESKPIVLERKPLELTVDLPIGSKAGRYELELKKDDKTLLSTSSDAEIQNGTTSFTAKVDLSSFEPGDYRMFVRQLPFDWNHYPVIIR